MTAVALINREDIIRQVASGAMLTAVAKSLGIAAPNISKHLANDPEYRQAREIGAEIRLHQAFDRVQEIAELGVDESGKIIGISSEQGNLARIRESAFKAAAWFAEREFPHRWGQHTQVTVSTGDLGERLRRARERVIEAEPAGAAQQVQCSIESSVSESAKDK